MPNYFVTVGKLQWIHVLYTFDDMLILGFEHPSRTYMYIALSLSLLSRSVYCVYLKDKQQTFRIVFFCSCGFLCTVFLNICFYRFAVKYLKTCYNAVEGVFVFSINKRLCKIKAVKSKKYTS